MKQDNILTLKGKILAGAVERVTLFDGRFDTAYRILSIVITPELIQAVREKGFFLNAAGGLITLKGLKERKEKDKEKHMYGGIVKLGIERMANG